MPSEPALLLRHHRPFIAFWLARIFTASGRSIDIAVMDLFRIVDGRLVEHWALLDNLGLLKQVGALPA